jgi:Fic family protein
MSYPSLKKLYYQNEKNWQKEYEARYHAPFTEHFNFIIQEYNHKEAHPCFLCYTGEILTLIERIHKLNKNSLLLLEQLPKLASRQYMEACMVEEIQTSNEIESVHSSRKEIYQAFEVVNSNSANKGVRFYSVVNKYLNLLTNNPITFQSCADIRKFYDEFIAEEIKSENPANLPDGKIFRAEQVEITTGTQKIIHRGTYPEKALIKQMEQALALLNDKKLSSLLRISLFHYLFGYIHPFYDGNGRTSRFITSYFLAKELSPLIALNISLVIKLNIKRYYEIFSETNASLNRGDLTIFVNGFLNIIYDAALETSNYLQSKCEEYTHFLNRITALHIQETLTKAIYITLLQASLFSEYGIGINELAKIHQKSRNTINTRLKSLPEGHLLIHKSNKQLKFKLCLNRL